MQQLSLPKRQPKRKVRQRQTSLAAYDSAKERITAVQLVIMDLLRYFGPLTDEDIRPRLCGYSHISVSQSGLRTRRAELVKLGRVRDSGLRGKTQSGRSSIKWEAIR